MLAAAQLAVATGLLAVTLPFAGRQAVYLTSTGFSAILVLDILGTGLAYVINFALISTEGATSASVQWRLDPDDELTPRHLQPPHYPAAMGQNGPPENRS